MFFFYPRGGSLRAEEPKRTPFQSHGSHRDGQLQYQRLHHDASRWHKPPLCRQAGMTNSKCGSCAWLKELQLQFLLAPNQVTPTPKHLLSPSSISHSHAALRRHAARAQRRAPPLFTATLFTAPFARWASGVRLRPKAKAGIVSGQVARSKVKSLYPHCFTSQFQRHAMPRPWGNSCSLFCFVLVSFFFWRMCCLQARDVDPISQALRVALANFKDSCEWRKLSGLVGG